MSPCSPPPPRLLLCFQGPILSILPSRWIYCPRCWEYNGFGCSTAIVAFLSGVRMLPLRDSPRSPYPCWLFLGQVRFEPFERPRSGCRPPATGDFSSVTMIFLINLSRPPDISQFPLVVRWIFNLGKLWPETFAPFEADVRSGIFNFESCG